MSNIIDKIKALKPSGKSFDAEDWARYHAIDEVLLIIQNEDNSKDELENVPEDVVRFYSDMSPQDYLEILREQDGDLILTIFSSGISQQRRSASIQLCTSQGGGKHHALWMALARIYKKAMGEEILDIDFDK